MPLSRTARQDRRAAIGTIYVQTLDCAWDTAASGIGEAAQTGASLDLTARHCVSIVC